MQFYDFIENQDWNTVYEYVNTINANPEFFDGIDKYELAELSFCVWYLLAEMGRYPKFDQNFYPDLEEVLYNAYLYYQKKFTGDNDFIFLMGYMISLFPENFPKLGDYLSVKEFGKRLMEIAYQNEPNNPFIYLLNLRNGSDSGDKETILLARAYVSTKFKNCKGLTDYFQRIL